MEVEVIEVLNDLKKDSEKYRSKKLDYDQRQKNYVLFKAMAYNKLELDFGESFTHQKIKLFWKEQEDLWDKYKSPF